MDAAKLTFEYANINEDLIVELVSEDHVISEILVNPEKEEIHYILPDYPYAICKLKISTFQTFYSNAFNVRGLKFFNDFPNHLEINSEFNIRWKNVEMGIGDLKIVSKDESFQKNIYGGFNFDQFDEYSYKIDVAEGDYKLVFKDDVLQKGDTSKTFYAFHNDGPTFITNSININENPIVGQSLGFVEYLNEEEWQKVYHFITEDSLLKYLHIDTLSGELSVVDSSLFDFELNSSLIIPYMLNDSSIFSSVTTGEITIIIDDLNEAPYINNPIDKVITYEDDEFEYTISNSLFKDDDTNETLTYSILIYPESDWLDINTELLTLSGLPLNNDVGDYSIEVKVKDKGNLEASYVFPFEVINTNDPPTNITLSDTTIFENEPFETIISAVEIEDVDHGDNHIIILQEGNFDNENFLVTNSKLKSNKIFNYEEDSIYTIFIKAQDEGGASFNKNISILVKDVNEAPEVKNEIFTIDETALSGDIIGNLSATDPEGLELAYQIVSGNGSNIFKIEQTGNIVLNGLLDYETAQKHEIVIQVSDGKQSIEASIAINVNDIEEQVTGLFDNDQSSVQIFPNPSNGVFTIKLGNEIKGKTNIKITDLNGKIIKRFNVTFDDENKVDCVLSDFRYGLHLVAIKNENYSVVKKLLIARH